MNITLIHDVEPEFREPLSRAMRRLSQEHNVESFDLREMKIGYCRGCFSCWFKAPGRCIIDDDMKQILRSMAHTRKIIYVSPVRAGYISSRVKTAMDRFIPNILPYIYLYNNECHHPGRYDNVYDLGILLAQEAPINDETKGNIFNAFSRLSLNTHSPNVLTGIARPDEMEEKLYEMGNC